MTGIAARPARPGRPAVTALAVSLTLVGANAVAYAFTVLAARTLSPASYGELAALLGVLLIGVVPATGLQTAGALALADPGPARTTPGQVHAAALVITAGVGAGALAAAAPVAALLHLPDPATALWLAALLVPHTVLGGYLGILQGTDRFARVAAVTAVFTVGKTAGAIAGLLVGGTPDAALAGMTVGAAVGAGVGWLCCGAPPPGLAGAGALVRRALPAAAALLGFVVLTSVDVVLARHWLPAAEAGGYAVGAIITKVVFWLPQGVAVVVLPRLADPRRRGRATAVAVAVTAGLGAVLTLGVLGLGARALPMIGGAAYGAGIGAPGWLFAVLGTMLAVAQLLLYSGIAATDRIAGAAVWLALVVEVAAVAALAAGGRGSVAAIAGCATAAATLLVAAGLVRRRAAGRVA